MIYNRGPERIRGTIYLSILLLFAGYQCVNLFVPNADMVVATRILAAGFYSVVVFVYGPDAWRAVRKPEPEGTDFLIVGIVLSLLSHLGQTVYAVVYPLADAPTWLLNAEVVAPIVLLSMLAAMLHVCAPGAVDGTVPRKNRIALGVSVGAAVLLIGAILATRPDLGPAIDRARPWIGDFWRTGNLAPGAAPPPG